MLGESSLFFLRTCLLLNVNKVPKDRIIYEADVLNIYIHTILYVRPHGAYQNRIIRRVYGPSTDDRIARESGVRRVREMSNRSAEQGREGARLKDQNDVSIHRCGGRRVCVVKK